MSPAKEIGRNEHLPKRVNQVHWQARSGDTWQICHDAFRTMTEGTADEMEEHITKNDSRSKAATAGRQECRPLKPLSKSRVQVVKVEPRCLIEALSQTPGVEHEARIKAEFGEWHAHWQVGLKVQEESRGKAWSSGSKRKPWHHSEDGCAQEVLRRVRVPRGVGVDGFHPRVPMDLSDKRGGRLLTLFCTLTHLLHAHVSAHSACTVTCHTFLSVHTPHIFMRVNTHAWLKCLKRFVACACRTSPSRLLHSHVSPSVLAVP